MTMTMKSLLPVLFSVAWAPILWLLLSAALEPALFSLSGSHVFSQAVIIVASGLLVTMFFRLFRVLSEKIFGSRV